MASPNSTDTAQLRVTVTRFVPNESLDPEVGPLCAADNPVFLQKPDGSGPEDADRQVAFRTAARDLISVCRTNPGKRPVTLAFTVVSPEGTTLMPTEMLFKQTNLTDDPRGERNFKNIKLAGATISVDNHWDSHGKHADQTAPVWKYWIRVETPAGVHGWIDPGIENSDDQAN